MALVRKIRGQQNRPLVTVVIKGGKMKFSIWEYLLPTIGLFAVFIILLLIVCSYYIIRKNASSDKSTALFIPSVLFLLAVLSFINAFPAADQWGGLIGTKETGTIIGTVESIDRSTTFPMYWNHAEKRLTPASYITVSGVKYYTISCTDISSGDELRIDYCPNGNTVLAFEDTSLHIADDSFNIADNIPVGSNDTADISPLLTETQYVVLIGIVLLLLLAFQKKIAQKRKCYIYKSNITTDGLVYPRKISMYNCLTEIITTIFAVLSCLTGSPALIALLAIITLCLWGMRLTVQKTMVQFKNRQFIYISIGRTKKYDISMVQSAHFLPTRQSGCMKLEINLMGKKSIVLEELNFVGLDQFYDWLRNSGM